MQQFFEAVVGSPVFGIALALVLTVIGARMTSGASDLLLLAALLLLAVSIYRTPPLSHQAFGPRLCITLAIAGVVGVVFYLLTGWRTAPPPHQQKAQDRTEFLLEATRPLRTIGAVIEFDGPVTSDIGHFRAVLRLQNCHGEPWSDICVGVRDGYLARGKSVEFGWQQFVWSHNPDEQIQSLFFSDMRFTTDALDFGSGLWGKGPFKAINDLDRSYLTIYMTESLLARVRQITLRANNYRLMSLPPRYFAALDIERDHPFPPPWPVPLTDDEKQIWWKQLVLKGPNYDPKVAKGLFPPGTYDSFMLDFDVYTPLKDEQPA